MFVFLGFIGILLLVVAHEAGHFFAARKSGIDVEEFGIGFPPKAKTLARKNGTEYTLNWLPLGGFVKLKGEHDSDTTPGSFGAARLRDKVKVMVAGVIVNFLIAFILFTLLALVGLPRLVDNQFTVPSDTVVTRQDILAGYIAPDSPADKAGLQQNDVLLKVDSQKQCYDYGCYFDITEASELGDATSQLAGETVDITVLRESEQKVITAQLLTEEEVEASKNTDQPKGYLGVVPAEIVNRRSTWSAPIVGAGVTAQFTQLTFEGLGNIFGSLLRGDTQPAREQATGVLGIGFVLSSIAFLGISYIVMIVAVISLSLAVMNILPIPALDGGRLFVTLLYRVRGKELTKEKEEKIHGTGFAALMVLFLLITVLDVQRFIF